MESGAPRSLLFVKMGARAPVPYGVGATVSDILIIIIIIINICNVAQIMLIIARTTGVQTVVMNSDSNTRVI